MNVQKMTSFRVEANVTPKVGDNPRTTRQSAFVLAISTEDAIPIAIVGLDDVANTVDIVSVTAQGDAFVRVED